MPTTHFDLGALAINDKEIIIFGGFSEGSQKSAYLYSTGPEDGSFQQTKGLETPDFFLQNGVYIEVPNMSKRQIIFNGHIQNHMFDVESKEFRTLQLQQQ